MPIAFAGYARFHGPRRHEYAAGPTSRRSVSDGAAFYRKDFTLDLGPDGKPVGSRSDFVRGPDGKVAWWRNHGGLHGCQEQLG
ncbi:hypothetical protein N4P33_02990 [Streptomyces sp. 15-116A]|uniref:hypothetical protein n=1 Tax=Streptomyces sp. 15-116A TaxID=2259035 RepID=UPI0021B3B931|nr:hypothetical protein [Streptomyces sp. 15-116A]MCT7351135.1 hypothetical protein [Streptomyces sp. 15-116A]